MLRRRRGLEGKSERVLSLAHWRGRLNTLSPSRLSPSSLPTRGGYGAPDDSGSTLLARLQALQYPIFSVRDDWRASNESTGYASFALLLARGVEIDSDIGVYFYSPGKPLYAHGLKLGGQF